MPVSYMEKFLEVGLSESGLLLHEISIWNIRFSAYPIHEELPAVYGGVQLGVT